MKTLWDPSVRHELRDRLARLTPGATRRWGTMSAAQMVAHVNDCMRMAIGEMAIAPKKLPLRYPVIKQLIIYWLPFPKGAPTAPELVSRIPADWPSECATLVTLIDRFAERGQSSSGWPDHPAFGTMSAKRWGVLMYRHTHHHFKQFGL